MKRNRAYRATDVKNVRIDQVREHSGVPYRVGLDVSKDDVKAVILWSDGAFERPWRVKLPDEIPVFVEKLRELAGGREVIVAMEPTGTYGDPLRQALHDAGLSVHRVSPKASHDFAETFDGVPSQHDGKDAAIVAELSAIGKSTCWPFDRGSDTDQEMAYWIDWMDVQQGILTRWLGRLESLQARFWPESCGVLPIGSATMLRTLARYGGPTELAADTEAAATLQRWASYRLSPQKVEALVSSARASCGLRQSQAERAQVRNYAEEALNARRQVKHSKRRISEIAVDNPVIQQQKTFLGTGTAAVLWTYLGSPHLYHCAPAYRKAMGLNVKIRSSGRWIGHLKITKRGHSQIRRWLYFSALRLCQESWIRPWYLAKKHSGVESGHRATTALMRKLALAAHTVPVTGCSFDVRSLLPGAGRYHRKTR